jgi:CheY-like chemotaxis protein
LSGFHINSEASISNKDYRDVEGAIYVGHPRVVRQPHSSPPKKSEWVIAWKVLNSFKRLGNHADKQNYAQSANRAKSELRDAMSQAVCTPLNAIPGMAGLLSKSSLREERREYGSHFEKTMAGLLGLIDDTLDLAKMESGCFKSHSIRRRSPIGHRAGSGELIGGRIGCTSKLDNKSTFLVSAPFDVRNETETPDVAERVTTPPVQHAGQQTVSRILIVEDSQCNAMLVSNYLKGFGYELHFAEDGKIGVEKVISGNPDLVLMDIQMPVMDGLQATRAIRQWEVQTNAHPRPILALTAYSGAEAVRRSLEAGCTEHLTKPVKRATLLGAISSHLSGRIIILPSDCEGLVSNYLVTVRRDMDKILAAVHSKDFEIARRLGHRFNSSGESYGFPEITRGGAAVELAAMTANENEIRSQIQALANYLDVVEIVV